MPATNEASKATVRERAKARERRAKLKEAEEFSKAGIEKYDYGSTVHKQKIGTKAGDRQRMKLFKNQLLKERNGAQIVEKALQIAMDDEHPNQVAALKMCMDRILPVSMFEEEKKVDTFTINISSILQEAVGRVIDHNPGSDHLITVTNSISKKRDDEEDEE